ncbi:Crp/Fnr family transcriptional regulator [Metarhizobium album]|uniref:Crp/Fnr family transcriptional regulator n=1 Tax=Metarhizobium album TaxID=2182425 RepID=A0A2U2DQA3_9HYPH|nr:helix-turn-helix domain-containing protein [Rhizobium album]PWE55471.1 Crp/Fnr family transcriptional regulator [Rhizobium album]
MLQARSIHLVVDNRDGVALGVQPTSLSDLFVRQPVEQLSAGQALFFEGDAARHLFRVISGTIRIFKIISDGRRVITRFLHAGDIIGVSLKDVYLNSADAIGDACVQRVSRKTLEQELVRTPELGPEMFARMCDELAAQQDQMVLLSRKNAEERLCTFLRAEMRRAAANGAIGAMLELPMTRLDVADYLGLTIETVSRTLTKLANKGILSISGRHVVRIIRQAALAQLCGDDDEYAGERNMVACWARQHH